MIITFIVTGGSDSKYKKLMWTADQYDFDFTAATSVAIESPNYPEDYPARGKDCGWWLHAYPVGTMTMSCEKFNVNKDDPLCFHIWGKDDQCFYGKIEEPFQFPINMSLFIGYETEYGKDYWATLSFRRKSRRSGHGLGFRCSKLN